MINFKLIELFKNLQTKQHRSRRNADHEKVFVRNKRKKCIGL